MGQELVKLNILVTASQIALLAVVTLAAWLTHSTSQIAVAVGLICAIMLSIITAAGYTAEKKAITFELGLSNACGILAAFCLVLAIINHNSAPANVAPTLYLGFMFFAFISSGYSWMAAQVAKMYKAAEPKWMLFLMAAPVGIGPIADMIMRRRASRRSISA